MRRVGVAALLAVVAIAGVVLFSATSANEGMVNIRATLTGFKEVPPQLTPGHGTFSGKIDGTTLSYTLTYSDLSSDAIMAHIHFGQREVAAGVVVWLCGSSGNFAGPPGTPTCPAKGGPVSGVITPATLHGLPAQNVSAGDFNGLLAIIRSGEAYVNVHTTNHPGGEIRGQVEPGEE